MPSMKDTLQMERHARFKAKRRTEKKYQANHPKELEELFCYQTEQSQTKMSTRAREGGFIMVKASIYHQGIRIVTHLTAEPRIRDLNFTAAMTG